MCSWDELEDHSHQPIFVHLSCGSDEIVPVIVFYVQSVVEFCVHHTQTDVVSTSRYVVEVELNHAGSTRSVVPKGTTNFNLIFVEYCNVLKPQYVEGVVGYSRVCVTVVGVLAVHDGSQSSTVVF